MEKLIVFETGEINSLDSMNETIDIDTYIGEDYALGVGFIVNDNNVGTDIQYSSSTHGYYEVKVDIKNDNLDCIAEILYQNMSGEYNMTAILTN